MKIFISTSRNVQNTDEFKTFAAKLTTSDQILAWVTSTFRRWLMTDGPATKIDVVSDDSPQWAKDAAAKGELFQVDYDAAENVVRPVIDYFKYLEQQGKRFSQINFEEADKQQREWHAELAKKAGSSATVEEDGTSVIKQFDDGYTWVKVFGEASLNREGEIMGHCVGSYYKEVKEGTTGIYSLRDRKNIPHVTIELDTSSASIEQIKGKANETVIVKYRPYVLEFLKLQPYNHIDIDQSGLKLSDVKKVVQTVPKKSTPIVFNGISFTHVAPARPTFNHHDDYEKVVCKVGGSSLTLYENKLPDNRMGGGKALIAMLEYCQDKEICGFSFYSEPKNYDAVVYGPAKSEYNSLVLSRTTYSQDVGSSKFLFSNKPGGLWPLVNTRNGKADRGTILQVNSAGTPLVKMSVEGKRVLVHDVLKVPSESGIADLKKWLAKRQVVFIILSSRKEVIALEEALNKGVKSDLPTGKSLFYTGIESNPALVKSIEFFAGKKSFPTLMQHAKACDKLKTYDEVRAYYKKQKIGMSGYLYTYFDAFFILLCMKNKKLAFTCIANNTALAKQFDAFTVAPASILSGAFARGKDDLPSMYKEVNRHMKLMMPWQHDWAENASIHTKFERIRSRFYKL